MQNRCLLLVILTITACSQREPMQKKTVTAGDHVPQNQNILTKQEIAAGMAIAF